MENMSPTTEVVTKENFQAIKNLLWEIDLNYYWMSIYIEKEKIKLQIGGEVGSKFQEGRWY
jgi:hypothetical protein